MYNIPLFDLNFDEREEKAVIETLKSKWISSGPKCIELEEMFCKMWNIKYAVSLSNCTSALHLAMIVCGIKENDELICPSLTFVATVNCIRYVNAIPVFADIKSYEDLTIDPEDIRKKITNKTKAIIVMHYGGFACDMDKIMEIANEHNLKVIEDACHGPLSEYSPRGIINDSLQSVNKDDESIPRGKGRKLGTIGDVGCFSFFSNKNISTGEGGMLITNNEEHFKKAKLLRSHGMTTLSFERSKGHSTTYDVVDLGYNYRMDDIRASIGIVQLKKLKDDLMKRAILRKYYIDKLSPIENIIIPFKDYEGFSSNYILPIILKNSTFEKREELRNKLAESGIQTSVHYPAVHHFEIYELFSANLPVTDYVSNSLITLPMHSKLTNEDVDYITEKLKKIVDNEKR